jgi:hypothetical protein
VRIFAISVCGAISFGFVVSMSCHVCQAFGQEQNSSPPANKASARPTPTPQQPARDLAKWPFFPKQVFLTAQRGSEWLQRANRGDGRFSPGYVPALRVALEEDNFLHQAAAAFALGKAAKYFGNEQAAAVSRQAVLTLLELDTARVPPNDPSVRICTLPAGLVNPVAAAAALAQAVYELPAAGSDILEQADQLCNGLRQIIKNDNPPTDLQNSEMLNTLIHGYKHRPEPWKLDFVRQALSVDQSRWRTGKSLGQIPKQTAAYAEAYLLTKDNAFADFVFEMNDWLVTLQYEQTDSQHPHWLGGFMTWRDGKAIPVAPQVDAAAYACSLIDAARLARELGDVPRWERYKAGVELCLRFFINLQYTEANTQHFAEWFRPAIVGAFHASHSDGNVRLDFTALAVTAMIGYLTEIAEVK